MRRAGSSTLESGLAKPAAVRNPIGLQGRGLMGSGATLRVILSGLALLATSGPLAAGPRERTLAPALLDLVQDALWLTGDYSGSINNRASTKDINEALKAFRAREGLAAGEGGHREIEKLKARARA